MHLLAIAIFNLALLSACSSLQISDNKKYFEPIWKILPSIPESCLEEITNDCFAGDSPLEIGNQKYKDLNYLSDELRQVFDNTYINTENGEIDKSLLIALDQIYAAATQQIQDEKILLLKQRKEIQKEPKQLPDRPKEFGVIQDGYPNTKQYLDCKTAFNSLKIVDNIKKITLTKKRILMAAVYTKYVAKCFDAAPPELLERLALFWTDWGKGKDGQPLGQYCLGYALTGKYIVTAKHCLADPVLLHLMKVGDLPLNPIEISPIPQSKISFAFNPKVFYDYRISPKHKSLSLNLYSPLLSNDDLAVVELITPRVLPLVTMSSHQNWNKILTITTFYSYDQLQKCINSFDIETCTLSDLIRADTSPNCVSPIRLNACMLHACQTRKGSSGGPIFAVDNNSFKLIGIHTGAIDDPKNAPCNLPRGQYYPNYGIAIDSTNIILNILQNNN